jgi:hypothetical protein
MKKAGINFPAFFLMNFGKHWRFCAACCVAIRSSAIL